jgi:hypothetical protein
MRKLIFLAIMVSSGFTLFAQSLEDVQEKVTKGKYTEAKEKIDKLLADAKGQKNANAWYYKGIVYYNLSLDSTITQEKDYKQEAYDAYKKYYEMDPKNLLGTLEQNARIFQLYDGYYNAAVNDFNNKNFESSFKNFSKTLNVANFINEKKFTYSDFTLPALDTNLILNVAAAATKANMTDSAMSYYKKLADAKLSDSVYIEIYQLLVDYYGKKNDIENRNKYLAIGKELYPTSDYWYDVDLQPLENDKPKLIAKYEELLGKNPNSYYLTYNYAVELFNYLYATDKKPADAATYEPKVEPAIANAIRVKPGPDGNLLMVRYLSAQVYQLEDEARLIKGTKPEDVKKRQALVAQTNAMWDKLAPFATEAFNGYTAKTDLKGFEKGNLKFVSNILIDYYTMKKDAAKAKVYQDKMKELGI